MSRNKSRKNTYQVEALAKTGSKVPTKGLYKGASINDRSLTMIGATLNKSVINSFIFSAQQGDMRRFSAFKREMLSDPFLSGEVNKIKSKLISSPITFGTFPTNLDKPAFANTSDSKRAHQITDYCKEQLLDSSDMLREVISKLWYGILDGVAVIEIIAEVQNGKVVLKELVPVPQERIAYIPGTTTLGVQLGEDQAKLTPLDQLDSNFIVLIADETDPNPAHRGLLRKCVSPWFDSRYVSEWWSRATELNGTPTRVAYYNPSDQDMKAELDSLMAFAGSSTYMVLPEGTHIDHINSINAANTDLYSKKLDACHELISIALLGATQTTQIKPNSGSRASSEVHLAVSSHTINGYALRICATLRDQLISRLVEWQFSEEDSHRFTPTMTIQVMGYEDIEKMAISLPALAASGLPIATSYVYEVLGIPIPDPTEAILKAAPTSTGSPSTSPSKDPPSSDQMLSQQFSTREQAIEKQVGDILIGPYSQHIEKLKSEGADLKRIGASLNLFSLSKGESKKKAQEVVQAFMVSEFLKGYHANAS